MDTKQTIDRLDSKVTAVNHDRSYTAPRYSVTVLGELIHLYIDSPHSTVADYLQNVPEDATYLVGFEGAASDWWWGHIGGSLPVRVPRPSWVPWLTATLAKHSLCPPRNAETRQWFIEQTE